MRGFGRLLIHGAPLILATALGCSDNPTEATAVDAGTVQVPQTEASTVVPQEAAAPAAEAAAPAAVTVNIPVGAMGLGPAAYGANPLVVAVGTTVTWVNTDSIAHTSTSDTGVWDSGVLAPGATFSFTFTQSGMFPYHCTIHGAASMSGAVQVQ